MAGLEVLSLKEKQDGCYMYTLHECEKIQLEFKLQPVLKSYRIKPKTKISLAPKTVLQHLHILAEGKPKLCSSVPCTDFLRKWHFCFMQDV